MKNSNEIYQKGLYRILEVLDEYATLKDLKGDCFDPEVNDDIHPNVLQRDEAAFEQEVEQEGVYGYILEVWNASVGMGWEQVDSCWGFVGRYEDYKHYIVDEFKDAIKEDIAP
jgi:hypothetical protein